MIQLFNVKNLLLALLIIAGSVQLQAQHEFAWVKGFGGSNVCNNIDVGSIALDTAGNVYIIGTFYIYNRFIPGAEMDFNPGGNSGKLISYGGADVFLAKYDADGNYLWARNLGSGNNSTGWGIAVDVNGNVYISGNFFDTMYFERGANAKYLVAAPHTNCQQAFIAKYDTDGNYIWVNSIGSRQNTLSGGANAQHIVLDLYGNIYVTGPFTGTVDFDPGPGLDTATAVMCIRVGSGESDVFLAKYDTTGNYYWTRRLAVGCGFHYGFNVGTDHAGNVYVVGAFNNIVDFDPDNRNANNNFLSPFGGWDGFIAKYQPDSKFVWAKQIGGIGDDAVRAITFDASDNMYITGTFSLTADFNSGGNADTLTSAGGFDAFIAKYDTAGKYIWAKGMGGADNTAHFSNYIVIGGENATGIVTDAAGNIYVGGCFTGTANFNRSGSSGILTSAGGTDAFLTKYNSNGTFIWVKGMGGNMPVVSLQSGEHIRSIAINKSGHLYAVGNFSGTADFNVGGTGGVLTATSPCVDAFLLKLACNDTSSHYISATECGDSYTLNGEVYSTNGIYVQHIPNATGCDSTITLDLTFDPHEKPIINVDEFVLGVAGSYVTYQWIKNGVDIPGATNATYTVTENADYQVRITNENGCIITSDVYVVTNVSIEDINTLGQLISIYPNPAGNVVYIKSPVAVAAYISGLDGRILLQPGGRVEQINTKALVPGVYFLHITDLEGNLIKVEKVMKQ